MGDFGCESTFLVGKTYELRWGLTAVLAADCEGNVDCGRSDMVPFVSAFKEVKAPQEKDCWGNAKTQLDANGCAYESLKEADAALNLVYKTIRAKYSDDELFLDKLKISQRAWIAFRDAELEAFFPHQTDTRRHYGSIYPVCRSRLLTRLTTERIKQLRVWLDGAKQGASCTGSVKLKYYLDQQND